jgi:hypothetical protein
MSGRRFDEDAEPIYKIGATTQDPRVRAKQIAEDMPLYPIRVLHAFPVDNMRVVESMLHTYYAHRCLDWLYTREWFDIDDEVYDLTRCAGIYVNDSLAQLSGNRSVRKWWLGLKGDDRWIVGLRLWKHPAIKIELERWQ